MRQLLLFVFCILCASTPVLAQFTGPVTTNHRVAWDLPGNITLSDAPSFEVRLRDGNFIPVTALTDVTCAAGSPVSCSAPVSASNADALNRVGVHTITLSLFRADVGESPQSSPFVVTSPAGAPTNLRLTSSGN